MMEGPTVNATEGRILGSINLSPRGMKYYSFTGIPYAKPPIGLLRFKDPVPHGPWIGTKDATKLGNSSPQLDLVRTFEYLGDDDSLIVNVHTTNLNPGILLPVMVYIHGGGFAMGNGSKFDPGFIVEKNVVYASMNYRLGVMGFLCTDPVNARGDMGLKDQNLALRWLKDNVEYFGGDPDNITIFGDSAGSASVEYHMLSKMSKDLFHRAIMESGSAVNIWAKSVKPFEISRRLADKLGYQPGCDKSVFAFLNGFETETLVNATVDLLDVDDLKCGQLIPFVPAINVFKDNKGFINDEPENILKAGKFNMVPTITGFCNDEGLFMKFFYSDADVWNDLKSGKFLDYIPRYLNKKFKGGNERLNEMYSPNTNARNKDGHVYDFISDVSIIGGILYSISQRLKHSKEDMYVYNFAHDGKLRWYGEEHYSNEGDVLHGVSHVDEILYLFVGQDTTNPDDLAMRNHLVDMWTDFAKTGNPTPNPSKMKWVPTRNERFQYMQLDLNFKMESKLENRKKLWDEIYSK